MSGVPTVWLWVGWLVALTLTIVVGKRFTHYTLATSATPGGILEFELAGDARRARRIVDAWRAARVLDRARPNLRLDMVWIPCYTATLALGCVIATRLFEGWWASAGAVIAAGQVLAGLLDYGENLALLRTLDDATRSSRDRTTDEAGRDPPGGGQTHHVPPRFAAWCARMKLRLTTLGLVYLLIALLLRLLT